MCFIIIDLTSTGKFGLTQAMYPVSHKELSPRVWSLIDLPRHVSFDSIALPFPHPKREDAYYFVSHFLCLNTSNYSEKG